ncbi:50S ribosomal protein L18 [Sulfuricurvum sp. IAE1]|jgi:large subunit ribosomal protein L18|uniref:50S ribosomal protein L18 n=1 Tax=Sulfuricurvum sp. IAE1 TaxID=2546102 RepID=UPI001045BA4B|nr:50S ribosomal protein L18 [Sulfuricurvum sp. IAE1]MDD3769638.1 50S ribosomal protein L18 [Sulfuricurvum sp.]MDX9965502.1 50S ribosomal protein L18 [Sulfuricurvum sp.]TDA62691.1 50S ribosomal protein L18 [Sulfuricurvum sp. IAE1]
MTGKILKIKAAKRVQRKRRIRSKIAGCATLPRVSVFRSNRYISAQAINDEQGVTLASVHSKTLGLRANKEGAEKAAAAFAKTLKDAGINEITFDRNGFLYHGVVKAFAESLRANEIKF